MIAAVLVVAAAIRIWKLGYGLPAFLDEALPFRWALAMWSGVDGRIDWNPHRFHHPSLATYLHLGVQQATYSMGHLFGHYHHPADYTLGFRVDPTLMALSARSVGVAADLATVFLTARLGDRIRPRSGWLAALLIACSPTLVVASRSIYADSVMLPFAVAGMERMLAYRAHGGAGRLVAAAVLIGLAAGAKYPAAALLLPLAAALWMRGGPRALGRWPLAAAIAGAVFLATTPFAALDFATFRRDMGFVRELAQKGHLGNLETTGFLFHLRTMSRDLSWLGIPLLLASLAWTAARLRVRPDAALVLIALLAFGIPIALGRVEAERYLLPILPLAAVLIAELLPAAASRLPDRARAAAVAAAALTLVLPAAVAGVRAVVASDEDTRIDALRWCEAHLTSRDLVMQEHYGAPLLGRMDWLAVRGDRIYGAASPEMRRRYDERRWFSSVTLPLAVVGSSANSVRPRSGGAPVDVEVFPHAAEFNHMVYEPRFLLGVDYFATSSSVRGRFEADPARYVAENRFYALLDSAAEVAARFRPRAGSGGGPEIACYRLGPRAQRALAGLGPLDTLWWAATIPNAYRERAEVLLAPERSSGGAVRLPDGSPALWVLSLRAVYQYMFADFGLVMGSELADRLRYAEARRFAAANLVVAPEDEQACVLHAVCSAQLGDLPAARWVIERSLEAYHAAGQDSPTLRLHLGEVLRTMGDVEGARREWTRAAAAGGDVGAEARQRLERTR